MANMYPTYDYEAEQSDIARRQKVADAMLGGALAPIDLPQQTGPIASKVSPLAIIAKLVQAKVASASAEELKKEKATLAERYKGDLTSGIGEYLRTSQGYEAPSFPGEGAPMEKVAGDPRKAIMEAIASNHPVLQAFGMKQMEELGKGTLTAKDLSSLATPASVLANPNAPATWTPQRKLTSQTPGQIMVDEAGNVAEPTPMTGAQSPYGPSGWREEMHDGDRYAVTATGPRKLDNAPKVSVGITNSPVTKGESEFMKTIGKQNADAVSGAQAKKQSGQRMLVLADNLDKLESSGVFSGPASTIAMTVGSFADSLGMSIDKQKLASSETYQALIAKEVAAVITSREAGVGKSMSEGDRVVFERQFPQLLLSKTGRKTIVEKLRQTGNEDIKYSDAVTKKIKEIYPEAGNLIDIAPASSPYPVNPGKKTEGKKAIKWDDYP